MPYFIWLATNSTLAFFGTQIYFALPRWPGKGLIFVGVPTLLLVVFRVLRPDAAVLRGLCDAEERFAFSVGFSLGAFAALLARILS
jgi:hypothetical protein